MTETYNVYVEERITGRLVRVYVGRTPDEIRALFEIGVHGMSPIEDDIGVRLIELTANEYISAGYYVRILERENWLSDREGLR